MYWLSKVISVSYSKQSSITMKEEDGIIYSEETYTVGTYYILLPNLIHLVVWNVKELWWEELQHNKSIAAGASRLTVVRFLLTSLAREARRLNV